MNLYESIKDQLLDTRVKETEANTKNISFEEFRKDIYNIFEMYEEAMQDDYMDSFSGTPDSYANETLGQNLWEYLFYKYNVPESVINGQTEYLINNYINHHKKFENALKAVYCYIGRSNTRKATNESENASNSKDDSEDFYNFQEKYASTINKLYDERYGTPDANTSNGKVDTTLWENLASEFYDEFKNNMNESDNVLYMHNPKLNKSILYLKKKDAWYSSDEGKLPKEYKSKEDIRKGFTGGWKVINSTDKNLDKLFNELKKNKGKLVKESVWVPTPEELDDFINHLEVVEEEPSYVIDPMEVKKLTRICKRFDKNASPAIVMTRYYRDLKTKGYTEVNGHKIDAKVLNESEDDTRIMEIIPDSGANGDYINVIIYQGNKLILDKNFYYGYDISNSEEMERIAHRDYERSIEYNWNEPYYYKEKPYTPKLIKKLMDEYNISSNNVILRPAENTSWHPKNYSSNSHIEITKEMLKDLNINQEVEPSFHDSIIVKENPDKSIYIKDLHGNELTFENVEDAIKNFEKDFDIISTKDNDRTKIAEHKMNGYILSNLWAIKKEARGDN